MNKLTITILLLILLIVGFFAAGYRVHPENLDYYFKQDSSGPKSEIIFKNGKTLTGVISEEEGDKIRVNVEGAGVVFSKSEIDSTHTVTSANYMEVLQKNYKSQSALHPLITQSKEASIQGKFDSFVGESDRISEEIRKKHPEITGQAQMQQAMEQAHAAQTLAKARQAAAVAEMERS